MNSEGRSSEPAERQRVRLVYEKGESIKFISHQDEFRAWERAIRRAGLPLLYKQGFNPQPHIQFAAPLGVGFTGNNELIDVIFSPPLPLDELYRRISEKLPPGLTLHSLREIALNAPSLQSVLIGADYTIVLYAEPDEISPELIQARIEEFLAQEQIARQRQRKGQRYRYNLRRLIFELQYQGYNEETEEHRIFVRVQQREGATGRPDEVLAALDLTNLARTLHRDRLYFEDIPEDAEIFAAYPVVTQQEISLPLEPEREEASHPTPQPERKGRTLGERAADEFI